MTRRVEIHVEELVLHGFPPLDARALADAVERELAALAASGAVRAPAGADAVHGGSFRAAAVDPARIGAGIARRLHPVVAGATGAGRGAGSDDAEHGGDGQVPNL